MDLGENIGILAIGSVFILALICLISAINERNPKVKKGLFLASIVIAVGNSIGMMIPGPIGGFATAWGIVLFLGGWFLGSILLVVKLMR